ncbi:MAG TPA: hypothetical protein VL326_24805 [Kofleriaceae bacterium]|nr:hypothetical protein [Kofleriaceae bacterium]
MRILAVVLCLVAGCGSCSCKDDAAAKKEAEPAVTEAKRAPAPPRPSLEPAQVSGLGVVPAAQLGPKLVLSKDAISLDGEPLIAITEDGVLDPERLETLTRQLEQKATSDAPIGLTLDATVPVRRVSILLDVLKRGGFRNIALLLGSGSSMIPMELVDSQELTASTLRPVVTVKSNYVSLWSESGEEGTMTKPKLAYVLQTPPDFAPVTRALADIVERRWPSGRRDAADKMIILEIEGTKPAQVLLQVAAAVRTDGSLELFPGIYLSAGR